MLVSSAFGFGIVSAYSGSPESDVLLHLVPAFTLSKAMETGPEVCCCSPGGPRKLRFWKPGSETRNGMVLGDLIP